MDGLVSTEFLGFPPDKLYKEIYAVGYNEFIDAVKALKDTLHQEFPNKTDEIDQGCDSLLAEYCQKFDREWFERFIQYCSKNIFSIPHHVPVYDPQLSESDANQDAFVRVRELKNKIMAMEYLNCKLMEKIRDVDREILERQKLLTRIRELKIKAEVVKHGQELESQLKSITDDMTSDSDTN